MTAHLSKIELEKYRRGAATPAELLAFDDHLAECSDCRTRAGGEARAEAQLGLLVADYRAAAAAEPAHPDYEELSAYVDGRLSGVEKEILQTHLAACTACAHEERDLRDFRNTVAPDLHKRYEPAAVQTTESTLTERVRSWLRALSTRPVTWQVALVASLLLAGAALWLGWNAQRAGRQAQVAKQAESPTPNASTPQVAGAASPTPSRGPSGSGALLALNDGAGKISLNEQGQLTGLEGLPAPTQVTIKKALERQKVANPAALAELGESSGVLMSGRPADQAFAVLGPVGEVVESDRPTFRWQALAGASSYTVKVFDQNFNLVAQSQALPTTMFRPATPLARGAVYSWQVTALKDGQEVKAPRPPAPQAKFKVLDAAAAAELRRARQSQPVSHLALGVLYARAGLLIEAERELRALSQANPQSEAARQLLADVRAARRGR